MRVALASVFTPEFEDIRQIVEPNRIAYCERHDYTYLPAYKNLARGRKATWSKIPLIHKNLNRFDWIIWLDADAFIVNQDIPLTEFCLDDLVIGEDGNGINAGAYVVRCNESVSRFLRLVYATHAARRHKWQDQFGMSHNLDKIKHRIISREVFNCYPWEDTSKAFFLHFPGCKNRAAMMRTTLGIG